MHSARLAMRAAQLPPSGCERHGVRGRHDGDKCVRGVCTWCVYVYLAAHHSGVLWCLHRRDENARVRFHKLRQPMHHLDDSVGLQDTSAAYGVRAEFWFGPLDQGLRSAAGPAIMRPCVVGCLLDLDAAPARMTVFVDGEPLAVQCEYDFPKDGRAWFPSVALPVGVWYEHALHSCAM
jgi:hypothetical protein